jgi:hypothetical protein
VIEIGGLIINMYIDTYVNSYRRNTRESEFHKMFSICSVI